MKPSSLQQQVEPLIRRALEEDIGSGDVTTRAILEPDAVYGGQMIAKAPGVVAGLEVAHWTFQLLDPSVKFQALVPDGHSVKAFEVIARVKGNGRALLTGERVALNFVQRMSGIATLTRQFVSAVSGTRAVILDTRKTAPGLRILDRWAVRLGGGQNHRFGLFDMVLIKDNHIQAAGSITRAVERVRQQYGQQYPIEVEVKDLNELDEALALRVDRILLDNMDIPTLRQAVERTGGRILLEASGNISLDNVAEVARTGVDYISVGQLTHSVKALDISFRLEPIPDSNT
ncbi:MAG: carboxylating nicotinate-nucleotide diphosphorylase [Calditrichaeota bacterium]|nr:carboxylating nicotinate-nucleotide diphosphorylase [Calditrichota bacterium]